MVDFLLEILGYMLGDILIETRIGRILLGLAVIVGLGIAVYVFIRLVSG